MASAEDTQMLPDPPDGKEDSSKPHASFRDKLLAGKDGIKDTTRVDLISNNLFRIEYEDGDRLKPRCYVADSVLQNLQHPWTEAEHGNSARNELNKGTNQEDPGSQSSAPKIVEANLMNAQEQLHGEWLVVSRSRKPNAQKGKSKVKINSFVAKAKPTFSSRINKLGKKRSRVELKSPPVEKGLSSTKKDDRQKTADDQCTTSDKSNGKGISMDKTTGLSSNSNIFKPASARNKSMADFGIKIAMNVEIIEPNRLRFKEDEELHKS
ncbi:zinc ion binding nucleic acid binding protein [Sesbania bispinosa]|nr:zinc ion binding nucleic acid binding protein [Sesbania bispinosa]